MLKPLALSSSYPLLAPACARNATMTYHPAVDSATQISLKDSAWDRSSRINRRVLLVSQALTPRQQASSTKLPIQSQEFSERLSFGPPQQFWIMLWKRKNWALLPCFYSFHSIRWGVLEMLQWQPMTRAYFQIYIATISALWRSKRIFSKCQIHYRIWVFWKCLAVSQLNLWFKFIPASIHSTVNSRECLQIGTKITELNQATIQIVELFSQLVEIQRALG